jgi:hypothetical protein
VHEPAALGRHVCALVCGRAPPRQRHPLSPRTDRRGDGHLGAQARWVTGWLTGAGRGLAGARRGSQVVSVPAGCGARAGHARHAHCAVAVRRCPHCRCRLAR